MQLLDTDILIDVQRGHPPAVGWFQALDSIPSISGFVAMEILQNSRNSREMGHAHKFISPLLRVWPTARECENALQLFGDFHLSHGLGLIDALIGATAIGQNATLCTFNKKHYQFIPSLNITAPYSRYVLDR